MTTFTALSSGRGPRWCKSAWLLATFALPGAMFWAAIISLLSRIGGVRQMLWLTVGYALAFGIAEALVLPIRAPGLQWQVPAGWLRHNPFRQLIIWGAVLGPGVFARNPYAGLWLIAPLIILGGSPQLAPAVGAIAGLAHGAGQALAVTRNAHALGVTDHLRIMTGQIVWRVFDGLLLVVVGTLLIG